MPTIEAFRLIGIALPYKTSNDYGRSAVDCGGLWHRFISDDVLNHIPGLLSPEVFAVYHDYDGDHTQPYAFFLGGRVEPGTEPPEGLSVLDIPEGEYTSVIATGVVPDSVMKAWDEIWASDIPRAYRPDFEVYGEGATDPENSEVDIFISID